MSKRKILVYLLGLLSMMFISLSIITNANAEESKATITIKNNSNNSGNEGSNNQENGNSGNKELNNQKETISQKAKQKHILRLPQTGEINSFEYIIFGICILGMSLLYTIKKRNGEIEDEKN